MFEIFSYQTQERGGQKRKVIKTIGLADQMYCRNDGVCGPKSLFLLDESISESGSGKGHTYNFSRTKNFFIQALLTLKKQYNLTSGDLKTSLNPSNTIQTPVQKFWLEHEVPYPNPKKKKS